MLWLLLKVREGTRTSVLQLFHPCKPQLLRYARNQFSLMWSPRCVPQESPSHLRVLQPSAQGSWFKDLEPNFLLL